MPSITTWNRLEPSPVARSLEPGLAARLADPLWLAARQYQLGEFQGADAGSPAYARVAATVSRFTAWAPSSQAPQALPSAPLEASTQAEPLRTDDVSLAVEIGQTVETLLAQAGAPDLIAVFRGAYPVSPPPLASGDRAAAAFVRVCGGRAIDGLTLYGDAKTSLPGLPAKLVVPAASSAVAQRVLGQLVPWVEEVFGVPATTDPPAWTPDRLEYGIDVFASTPDGNSTVLAAHPDESGDLDWYAFDVRRAAGPAPAGTVSRLQRSVVPGAVRLRGMPSARFWDFENRLADYADLRPDKCDVAKMMLLDFLLTQGNDWYLVPVELQVGSLCRIDQLLVRDVFGVDTLVPNDASNSGRWTMFSTSVEDGVASAAGFLVLPPSAGPVLQAGPVLEDVRFLRDEVADMVWAVEHTTQNGLGEPWPGRERASTGTSGATATSSSNVFAYRVQSSVPVNWIPFVPVVDPSNGGVSLQRSAMSGPDGSTGVPPVAKILLPKIAGTFRIREEEVPREGARVQRVIFRSRWIDGSTHTWIGRCRSFGRGEGASGLEFDVATPD